MNFWAKVWRGSKLRRTRFHDEKGNFALRSARDLGDAAFALLTTALRIFVGYRPVLPYIALNAVRFLETRMNPDARIFEWSSGMSTLWFEDRCAEIHSVEHNLRWFTFISERARRAKLYYLRDEQYVNKIREFPAAYFDLISIDGADRFACFALVDEYLRPGGILLIDDTDTERTNKGDLYKIDCWLAEKADYDVYRFTGWTHGNFFPHETTVCLRRS
jgi:hypothetical protein